MRWFAGLTSAICLSGLALQLHLVIVAADELGVGVPAALLAYASLFTIQTVFVAALITGWAAIGMDRRWPSARFKSAIAVYVSVAGLVFLVLLRPAFQHSGLQLWTDVILHYAVPPLYGIFWLCFVPKQSLRWRDAVFWQVYPLCYFAGAVAYGLWSRFYPYPFFDLPKIGAGALITAAVLLGISFLVTSLLIVAVGRLIGHRLR